MKELLFFVQDGLHAYGIIFDILTWRGTDPTARTSPTGYRSSSQ
jgi:hypothetical protein